MEKNYHEGIDENKLCSFYTKNGACRYGNQCTKLHIRPKGSLTLLFAHLYKNPPLAIALADGQPIPDDKIQEVVTHLESWYQEIFLEVSRFGEIREMHICDNLGDHLIGNIYIKFASSEDAENVKNNISRRYYRDRLVMPEFSPVTDFEEGSCRNFSKGGCKRGGSCNFLHVKVIRKELKRALFKKMFKDKPEYLERYQKKNDRKRKKEKKERKERKERKRDRKEKKDKRKDKKEKKERKKKIKKRKKSGDSDEGTVERKEDCKKGDQDGLFKNDAYAKNIHDENGKNLHDENGKNLHYENGKNLLGENRKNINDEKGKINFQDNEVKNIYIKEEAHGIDRNFEGDFIFKKKEFREGEEKKEIRENLEKIHFSDSGIKPEFLENNKNSSFIKNEEVSNLEKESSYHLKKEEI